MSVPIYFGPGVYEIKCIINGRAYYGQSENIPERIGGHISKLNAGGMINAELQADWTRYGPDNFQVNLLHSGSECSTIKRRLELENFYVEQNKETCYNAAGRSIIQQQTIEASRQTSSNYSRGKRVVITVGGVQYKSKGHAQRALNLGRGRFDTLLHTGGLGNAEALITNNASSNQRGLPNPPAEGRKLSIDGVVYNTILEVPGVAQNGVGLIFKRLMDKTDTAAFFITEGYEPLKKHSNRIVADGTEFASMDLCAKQYEPLHKTTLYNRCASPVFPDWYSIPGHI